MNEEIKYAMPYAAAIRPTSRFDAPRLLARNGRKMLEVSMEMLKRKLTSVSRNPSDM
jgi:hypothetical protein